MLQTKYAVIGAGLAGAATAWQLARAGHEVTVIEQYDVGHPYGSSHGSARIFRRVYPEAFYAHLTGRAEALWHELAAESGTKVLTTTGGLDFGAQRNPRKLARVLESLGIYSRLYSAEEARSLWPQINFDTEVLYQPDAGVVDADLAVRAMLDLACASGAQLLSGWPIGSVTPSASGYTLKSPGRPLVDAETVVLCAGAWLPEMLPELPLPAAAMRALPRLAVTQQQVFHFPVRDLADWPVFVHMGPLQVYGLPGGRDVDGLAMKVAEHDGGRPTTASGRDGIVDPAARDRLIDYVRTYLPGLRPTPVAEDTCLYTSTPTEDFLIDRIGGIVLVSPCSGHGAKFAPLVGKLAAGLATGRGRVPAEFTLAGSALGAL